MTSLLLALALLAADGGGPRFEGSVAAGGGWDGTLLIAPGAGSAGSAMGSVTATGGAGVELSEVAFLYVGGVLDGARFASLPELDRASAGAEATLLVDLVGPLALVVGSSGAWNWYADPARSGASVTARASLRLRPLRWLALRAGYGHAWRTAVDPVYATSIDRLFGEVEFRPFASTWLSLSAFGERGDLTFYEEILPSASGSGATAATTSVFLPYRAPATTTGLGVGIEQGLGAGISLDLGASLRRTITPDGDVTGPSVNLAATWRFD
ncbi:MAG TPA: hypothetical protein PLL32_06140 [Anaeromyxobacteraceae bacterium]|nr:hypothetical protein [Anaeromyxobacteraceae bacterium]